MQSAKSRINQVHFLSLAFVIFNFAVLIPPLPNLLPLAQAQTTQDRQTEASGLLKQGVQQMNQGEFHAALETLQQALAIYQQINDRPGAGETLYTLGKALYQLQRYPEALTAYQQALEFRTAAKDSEGEGIILNGIGRTYYRLNQYRRALEVFERALAVRLAVGDRRGEAITNDDIGTLYRSTGDYAKALEFHQKALATAQGLVAPAEEALMFNNLGLTLQALGQYRSALENYQQALQRFKATGNLPKVGETLANIGLIYINLGQLSAAEDTLQTALQTAQNSGSPANQAAMLNGVGAVNERLGRYSQALAAYQQAASLLQTGGNLSGSADMQNNIGIVYERLGQYAKALEFYQQALATRQQVRDRPGEGIALNNIGNLYRTLGQPQKALELYQQALKIAQTTGDYAGQAVGLNNLGATYSTLRNYQRAIELYQQAMAIRAELGDRLGLGITLGNLGSAYQSLKNYPEAMNYYQQSLAIARELGDRQTEQITLSNLASLCVEQKQVELAIVFFKNSVNVTESIRQDLRSLGRDQQESYAQTVAGSYRTLADLLLSQGRILEAQQVLELLKVQELRDFTRDASVRGSQPNRLDPNPAEAKILQDHGSLIAFGQKVEQCKQVNCSQKSQLLDQLDALTRQYNQTVASFEQQIRQRRSSDGAFIDPSKLGNIRKIVEAQPGTVLIYPFVLEDKIWLLWAAPGGVVKSVEVPVTRQRLGEAVLKFRQAMRQSASPQEIQIAGKQLYDWLIQPLEMELKANKIENLVFSLDRVTRYIPMAALFDGEKYLIENYTVSTVLSADLTNTKDRLSPGTQNTAVLAMGASTFKEFAALPNVPAELDGIVRQSSAEGKGVYPGQKFLDQGFDYKTLRDNLSGHKILHLATHGAFVPGRPENSYLVLGNDQKLTTEDIKALSDLNQIHLVVLSACETALGGPDQDGVEISGISSYFLTNGVAAVMASLWSVSDESTSVLMQRFYGYLAQGTPDKPVTKAQALRLAQLSLLYGKDLPVGGAGQRGLGVVEKPDAGSAGARSGDSALFARPFYWAPFVLIGNGL